MRRSVDFERRVVGLSGATGMIGNSSASMPLKFASYGPDLRWTVLVRTMRDISAGAGASGFTKSVKGFAGTVIDASSSIVAGTQALMRAWRFVAVSFRRPFSVLRSTLPRIGRLPRVE